MRIVAASCIAALLALLSPQVIPAEADRNQQQATPGAEQSTDNRADPPPATEASSTRKDRDGGEIFVPSEEISEDFAVSFPVDI